MKKDKIQNILKKIGKNLDISIVQIQRNFAVSYPEAVQIYNLLNKEKHDDNTLSSKECSEETES